MRFKPQVWARKGHRWGAAAVAVPFLVVIVTGLLLQVKKEWAWVQPPTAKGSSGRDMVSLDRVLAAAKRVPDAGVNGWDDIDRVDVQPGRRVAKVQAKSRWEVQVDLSTGEVLRADYRRSDVIESLHDGSFFHDRAKLWVFLPTAVVVLGLWVSGVYLFALPLWVKWRRRSRAA